MSALSIINMNHTTGERDLKAETNVSPARILEIRKEIAEHKQRDLARYWAGQMAVDFGRFFDAIEAAYSDPRTGEQADIDRWQDETEATRKGDYPI